MSTFKSIAADLAQVRTRLDRKVAQATESLAGPTQRGEMLRNAASIALSEGQPHLVRLREAEAVYRAQLSDAVAPKPLSALPVADAMVVLRLADAWQQMKPMGRQSILAELERDAGVHSMWARMVRDLPRELTGVAEPQRSKIAVSMLRAEAPESYEGLDGGLPDVEEARAAGRALLLGVQRAGAAVPVEWSYMLTDLKPLRWPHEAAEGDTSQMSVTFPERDAA